MPVGGHQATTATEGSHEGHTECAGRCGALRLGLAASPLAPKTNTEIRAVHLRANASFKNFRL